MSMSESDERYPVTADVAVRMLDVQDGRVHTIRSGPGILVGCDVDVADVIAAVKAHGCELSGDMATKMHHGLCLFDESGALFLRTKDS
jgi:hypothetical protein